MTATLSDAIEAAKQREAIARWDRGEAQLAPIQPPIVELSAAMRSCLDTWGIWAASKSVRKCPAKPHVVAVFVTEQNRLGAGAQHILATIEAITALHDHHGLSNPCATAVVNAALDQILKVEPPRSWGREERAEWVKLPPRVREAITRRERDRDLAVRRAQNKAAATNGAATKPIQSNGKGSEHHDHAQTF
jgi:hypothetical protein